MASKQRQELYISLAIFLLSTLGATLTYGHLRSSEIRNSLIIDDIQFGKQSYLIERNGVCVGSFLAHLDSLQNNFVLKMRGDLKLTVLGKEASPKIFFEAQFNSIGQMGASLLQISQEGSSFSIGSIDINPLRIKARFTAPGEAFERDFTAPGPVRIRKVSGKKYKIEYDQIRLPQGERNLFFKPLASLVDFSLVPVEGLSPTCPPERSGAIDVDALLKVVQLLSGSIKDRLPDLFRGIETQ